MPFFGSLPSTNNPDYDRMIDNNRTMRAALRKALEMLADRDHLDPPEIVELRVVINQGLRCTQ